MDYISAHSNILGIDIYYSPKADSNNIAQYSARHGIETTCAIVIDDLPPTVEAGNPILVY